MIKKGAVTMTLGDLIDLIKLIFEAIASLFSKKDEAANS